VLISGVIGQGPPRQLLDAAKAQTFHFYTSETLLAELLDVLSRDKFSARLEQAGLTAQGLVDDLRRIATLVAPPTVPRIVPADPDDDHVLACALAATAELIVSGDRHLLTLGSFEGIPIVKPEQALKIICR
jgi:putative PIN family toxin of toxin-antitoxin system